MVFAPSAGSRIGALRQSAEAGSSGTAFAIEHFVHWAVRHAGAMIAAMSGVDAVAFAGGFGEHKGAVRDAILRDLAFTGLVTRPEAPGPALHDQSSAV
ncbi:MAG: hypothetical protein AAF577_07815 [Pseudomonadota bacterium]